MAETCTIRANGPTGIAEITACASAWEAGLDEVVAKAAAGHEVLVLSPDTRIALTVEPAAIDEPWWQGAVGPAGGRVVDVSHAWRRLDIVGTGARDLLERAVEINLDPHHFPVGTATRTLCARTPVMLVAAGVAEFHVYAATSYADWLRRWLEDARLLMSAAEEEGHMR